MFFPLSFYWDCFSLSGLDRYFRCKTINKRFCDVIVAVMTSHCVRIYYPIKTLVLPKFLARIIYYSKELSPVIVLQHLKATRKILNCPSGKI